MGQIDEKSWRDRVFVTPAKAAEIIGYSVSTVRTLIFSETLRAVRQSRGGPVFVTVESLIEHIDAAEPLSSAELARFARGAREQEPAKLTVIQGGRK